MLQPTARPLPRPILGLAVSESEMVFAATEGPRHQSFRELALGSPRYLV